MKVSVFLVFSSFFYVYVFSRGDFGMFKFLSRGDSCGINDSSICSLNSSMWNSSDVLFGPSLYNISGYDLSGVISLYNADNNNTYYNQSCQMYRLCLGVSRSRTGASMYYVFDNVSDSGYGDFSSKYYGDSETGNAIVFNNVTIAALNITDCSQSADGILSSLITYYTGVNGGKKPSCI
ncbi:CRPV-038 [Crowpox virus]|nr:CRPV-038 [Crowpox virus]